MSEGREGRPSRSSRPVPDDLAGPVGGDGLASRPMPEGESACSRPARTSPCRPVRKPAISRRSRRFVVSASTGEDWGFRGQMVEAEVLVQADADGRQFTDLRRRLARFPLKLSLLQERPPVCPHDSRGGACSPTPYTTGRRPRCRRRLRPAGRRSSGRSLAGARSSAPTSRAWGWDLQVSWVVLNGPRGTDLDCPFAEPTVRVCRVP
jgi:hypothetical protein